MDPRRGKKINVCFIGDRPALGSIDVIRNFLTELVDGISMRLLLEPQCVSVPIQLGKLSLQCEEDEGGISGVAILSTSHIAIHTWPEHSYAVLDIYSCRDFDPGIALLHVLRTFRADPNRVFCRDNSESLRYPFELPTPDFLMSDDGRDGVPASTC